MRPLALLAAAAAALFTSPGGAQIPVLRPSDVVFMYQAPREIYREYGATVLAWGGTPRPESLEAASGMKFFGSVGMVTEFSRYYEFDPATYEAGLCRDLEGKPFKVPWLVDHQHKNIPYWWCCTRQPRFQEFIRSRVRETVKAGAYGVHIDDHLGTAGSLGPRGCFCERCVSGFPEYLRGRPADDQLREIDLGKLNYAQLLRDWLAADPKRNVYGHRLWREWRAYQLTGAAAFMMELRALASQTAGRPVPMSANACLTWGPHLNDYLALDMFSAEVPHHAPGRAMHEDPVVGYRMADTVDRPLASTASGEDWAFIKEHQLHGLVRGWIALGYASGHSLMAPHRQWCHTAEKGTHWYAGPKDQFAPLYQFVRENARLFDGFSPWADVVVAYSQDTYDADPSLLLNTCRTLLQAHLAYRLALAGNDAVPRRLSARDFAGFTPVLVLKPEDLDPAAQAEISRLNSTRKLTSLEAARDRCRPAASVPGETGRKLRVFPRVKDGAAVIHVVNWNYDGAADRFPSFENVPLRLDLEALAVPGAKRATLHAPGQTARELPLESGQIILPSVALWAIIEINR